MFCSKCGKELPNDAKFCIHCGAAVNYGFAADAQDARQTGGARQPAADAQPVYTASRAKTSNKKASGKKSSNKVSRILISVVVAAAAFTVGYYATGANKVKQPTAFDVPESFTFDAPPSPSIKETTTESKKDFYLDGGRGGDAYIHLFAGGDGTVGIIDGNMHFYHVSEAEDMDGIKHDAENAQVYLAEMGVSSSWVDITDEPEYDEYSLNFHFTLDDADVTELAAAFIGLELEDGKINIDTAEETLLGIGYTPYES